MQADDEVKVLVQPIKSTSNIVEGFPIEFGVATNQIVKLWGIKYSWEALTIGSRQGVMCLSNNPQHLVTPPASLKALILDPAVYAYFEWLMYLEVQGGQTMSTVQLPLYGLIVPKRQVLLSYQTLTTTGDQRAEIYYSAVTATPEEIGAVNLKQGKYRRK